MKEGENMKIEIEGSTKEIAALVLAIQEQRNQELSVTFDCPDTANGSGNNLVVKNDQRGVVRAEF